MPGFRFLYVTFMFPVLFSACEFAYAQEVEGGEKVARKIKPSKGFKAFLLDKKLKGQGDARQGADAIFVPDLKGLKSAGEGLAQEVWDRIEGIPFIFLDDSGDKPQASSKVRILTANGQLHFRFDCKEPDLKHLVYSSTGRDASSLWRDDTVEIFLRPKGRRTPHGCHFILNAAGALYDALGKGVVSWDPAVSRRASIKKNGWSVELSVPLRELVGEGEAEGTVSVAWPANVIRVRQGREGAFAEETGWRATGTQGGNVPERFGLLYFEILEKSKGKVLRDSKTTTRTAKARNLPATLKEPEALLRYLRGKYMCPAMAAGVPATVPELNGDLSDEAWKEAQTVRLIPLEEGIHPAELEGTEACVLIKNATLYLGIRSFERDVNSIVAEKRKGGREIWKDDSVEIFMAPGRKESSDYRQVIVNAVGSVYTGRGKRPGTLPGLVAKAKVGKKEWCVEVQIPLSGFGFKKGEVPALWGLNIIRNRAVRSGEPAQASGWSPPLAWTVHRPARFGSLWVPSGDSLPDFEDAAEINKWIKKGARQHQKNNGKLPEVVGRSNWEVFTAEGRETMKIRTMVQRHMQRILTEQYASRDKEWAQIKSWDDWLALKKKIRAHFLRSLGGFPQKKNPLNARVSTVFENDELLVERLVYESYPRFYVTANLVTPKKRNGKKVPAVIRLIGHSTRGRLGGPLRFCEDLARKGYAALTLDCLGQGERCYVNNGYGSRTPTSNHYFQGAACTLTGSNLAGYMINDVIRGLDYLATREEIDLKRVVVTGSSGGGTMSSYVAALEDRLFGAAPVSAVGSYRGGGGNYDSEQVLFGTSRDYLDAEGRSAMVAPKPLRIISEYGTEERKQKNIEAFEVSRKIFNLKKAGVKLEYIPTEFPHGYGKGHQQHFFDWVLKNMPPNPDVHIAKKPADYAIKDCYATKTWRSFYSRDLADRETVFSLNYKRISLELGFGKDVSSRKQAGEQAKALDKKLRELLVLKEKTFRAQKIESRGVETVEGLKVENLVLETEPQVFVPAKLFLAAPKGKNVKGGKGASVVWLLGRGKRSLIKGRWNEIRKMVEAGVSVLVPDLRACGESAVSADESFLGAETSLNGFGYRIAVPLIGMRVRDALCCVAYLRTRSDVDPKRIGLIGDSLSPYNPAHIRQPRLLIDPGLEPLYRAESLGPAVALLAYALDPQVRCCATRGALASYASVCEQPYFYHPLAAFVPGVLKHFDVADICAAAAPRPLLLAGSVNGRNQRLAAGDAESFRRTSSTYKLWKSAKALQVLPEGTAKDVVAFTLKKLAD